MEKSMIARRLYDDKFKNEIIGIVGSKKMIYEALKEIYFPFIDILVESTDDADTDEVTFDFYELGSVKFNFNFKHIKSPELTNNIRLENIKHVETKVVEKCQDSNRINKEIIDNMMRRSVLYTVCMKGMIKSVLQEKIFPYANIHFNEISDSESHCIIQFGNFRPIKFTFNFEPRNNKNYLLKQIS